ncbi:MAG: mannose-1-phosphate guanylyltransferase/mannose-6-phosphate isomerase [Chloroflexota bacterium]|nr:mannose-1-phosphate guanylyltransferase/mannose-6-phosphate isomerase [Chloroflexota bacterium]
MRLQPVILAGGSGSRLWPLSRQDMPKQFLPLMGERSLLQETALRLAGLEGCETPMVVCNESHRFLVLDQLREAGVEPPCVVLETQGRNTAPALALAAHEALQASPNDPPLLLAMPADHAIGDVEGFRNAVLEGAKVAGRGSLVTFGVTPDSPETGYGYIRTGAAVEASTALELKQFVEKPDAETAQAFLDSGDYLWNSGMFLMPATLWLEELERSRPDIAAACAKAMSAAQRATPFVRPEATAWSSCPSESIDYAVMERAGSEAPSGQPRYAVVPLDVGWSDVGAWSAVWEMGNHDAEGNRTQGDVFLRDTKNSLLVSRQRLLAGVGLEDIVVVETADAVLVAHRDRVQEVKQVVESLGQAGRTEPDSYPQVHRPWGVFSVVDSGPGFQVKRLTVHPGAAMSLQWHRHRAERWVVVQGEATVTRGDDVFTLGEGGSVDIPVGTVHRIENQGNGTLEIIEIQQGDYLGEDDIVRLDDKYGRHVDG